MHNKQKIFQWKLSNQALHHGQNYNGCFIDPQNQVLFQGTELCRNKRLHTQYGSGCKFKEIPPSHFQANSGYLYFIVILRNPMALPWQQIS